MTDEEIETARIGLVARFMKDGMNYSNASITAAKIISLEVSLTTLREERDALKEKYDKVNALLEAEMNKSLDLEMAAMHLREGSASLSVEQVVPMSEAEVQQYESYNHSAEFAWDPKTEPIAELRSEVESMQEVLECAKSYLANPAVAARLQGEQG